MRLHIKNILAGVGTGAVVVTLIVLGVMSFASISGSEREVTLTVVKETVPKSDPNASVDETAFVLHLYKANPDGSSEERPFGDKLFWLVDDDGVEPDPSVPNDTEPPTSLTRTFQIPSGGDDERYFLKEEPNEYAFKYKTYYTTWACYLADQYPSGVPFAKGFGRDANIDFSGKDNVTCKFVNIPTDAKLTVKKVFDPSISGNVQFYVQRNNNIYDGFELADGQSREVFLTSGYEFNLREEYTQKNLKTGFLKYDTFYSCDNGISGSGLGLDLGTINAGDDIKCTYTNKKSPEISVKKTVISGDKNKKFDFNLNFYDRLGKLNKSVPLSLGDGELESELYGTNQSGWVTKIVEIADPSYAVSYECNIYSHTGTLLNTLKDDKSEVSLPTLDFGQKVECEFFNKQTQIVIKKDVVDENGNDIFSDIGEEFEINNLTDRNGFSLDDNPNNIPDRDSERVVGVRHGVEYQFEEALSDIQKDKYNTTASCDNGSTGDTLLKIAPLKGGEKVTCVFTNKKVKTQIIIKKDVINSKGEDDNSDLGEGFDINNETDRNGFTLDDDSNTKWDSERAVDVKVGRGYEFNEALTDEQKQRYEVSVVCSDGTKSTNGSIIVPALSKGQTVICTFINKKLPDAKITIKKTVVPINGDTFRFNILDSAKKLLHILDLRSGDTKSQEIKAGTYTIQEILNIGGGSKNYSTSYDCTIKQTGQKFVGKDLSLTVTLKNGEEIECTFTNTAISKLTIIKDSTPNSPDSFEFRLNKHIPPNTVYTNIARFNLIDNGTNQNQKIFDLEEGRYQIKETPIPGYVTSYICNYTPNNPPPPAFSPIKGNGTDLLTFFIPAGYNVSCTFTNCKKTNPNDCPVEGEGTGDDR